MKKEKTKNGKKRGRGLFSPAGGQTAAQKVAWLAILIALALILSYVETLIPLNFGIPGIKLGLPNLVVVTGLCVLPAGEVLIISVARILLSGFLFGNMMSILYSFAGGMLSFLVMYLLLRFSRLSTMGVSIAGGVTHNIGQLLVAAAVVENIRLIYYLPALLVAGVLTGLLIGVLADRVLAALP
ncbi:MAG: Gx transporter family protein [Bilifractor sp.]|jgi:heptaprenyl diphosphate synthase